MCYRFAFFPYQRCFRQPLHTHHGIWEVREGIIIRLTDEIGRVSCGEIAPLPWFGSENLAQALIFCKQLKEKVTKKQIEEIPESLPACQFGFESALDSFVEEEKNVDDWSLLRGGVSYCYLLPAGEDALKVWETIANLSPITFKWKIGVRAVDEEIRVFKKLIQALPVNTKLRLDANGGLNLEAAKMWLEIADEVGIIEFIEQPLPPKEFDRMMELSVRYSTAIALDESVSNLKQLEDCYQKGWRGIYVIKAAIAGSPKRLRQFCRQYKIDAVFSSVFETKVGRESVLRLAAELSHLNRAVGFGINHWFEEDDEFLFK